MTIRVILLCLVFNELASPAALSGLSTGKTQAIRSAMNHLDRVLDAYDSGALGRRELLLSLAGLLFSSSARTAPPVTPRASLFRGATINHVTLYVSDVRRSKAFYTELLGLPIRDEGADFCEFRCGDGFLGLYAKRDAPSARTGIDHFCIGVEGLDVKKAFQSLKQALPSAAPELTEKDTQVYVRDPDSILVQLCNVNYKR